jgi:hypothetical protein
MKKEINFTLIIVRCDKERNATEKKWLDKVQELSMQKGGQMSEMQQGCETQTIQLQTQCFTKMMQISAEADKTTEALVVNGTFFLNARVQKQFKPIKIFCL